MMLPIVAVPFHINDQAKGSLTDVAIGQSDLGNSSISVPSLHVTLGCVKSTIKANYLTLSQKLRWEMISKIANNDFCLYRHT